MRLLVACFGMSAAIALAQTPAQLLAEAEALQSAGYRQAAIEKLEAALALPQQDRALTPRIHGALGKAYVLTGAFDKARASFETALVAAREQRLGELGAALLNDSGNLHAREGRDEEALRAYREGLAGASEARVPLLAARLAANAGNAAARLQRPAQARELYERSRSALAGLPDSRESAFLLIATAIGIQALEAPRWTEQRAAIVHAMLTRALDSAQAQGDTVLASHALGRLGALYESAGRHADALSFTDRAIFAAQQSHASESLFRWQWQSARLLNRVGRGDDSLGAYRRAIGALQSVRQDLMLDLLGSVGAYRQSAAPLYTEFTDLLLRRAPLADAGRAQGYLLEARDAVEQLKAVELEDYFQDDCVASLRARRTGIEAVSPNTAVLYPILLPDRIEILIGLERQMRQVTVLVRSDVVGEEIAALRRRLEKRSTHEYLPHARRLYDWLIRPIEDELRAGDVHTLVLVPDGALRTIPIAALHDGTQFLATKYATAVAPGLSLIEPRPLAQRPTRLLANGLSEAVHNFPALPFVDEEVAAIERTHGGVALRNREFVVTRLERELQGTAYSVVHIASHGHFDRDPKRSFLLSYDGKLSLDGLEQLMKRTRYREEPVELLTLSACRTAAGDDRAALGLAGVAIKAGARSALATLWFINDEASSALVTSFYEALKSEPSKAKALQQAQRRTMADPRYRHPGYWSPFLMIGNWL